MRTRTTIIMLGVAVCAVLLASPAVAEKRGVTVSGHTPAEFIAQQTGKSYAVVIGIDEYEHVRPLQYAVADAKAPAQYIAEQIGKAVRNDGTPTEWVSSFGFIPPNLILFVLLCSSRHQHFAIPFTEEANRA